MSDDDETYEEQVEEVEDYYSSEEIDSSEEDNHSDILEFDEDEVSEEEQIEEKIEDEELVDDSPIEQWEEDEEEIEDKEEPIDEELDMDMEDDHDINEIQEIIPKMQRRKEFNIDLKKNIDDSFFIFKKLDQNIFNEHMKTSLKEIITSEKNQNILFTNIEKETNPDLKLHMMRLLYIEQPLKDTLQSIKDKQYEYNTKFWDKYKDMMTEEVAKLKKKEEIESEEGSFTCPKCHKNQTRHYQVQLRSADEPMSIIIHCKNKECRHRWRIG